MTERHHKCFPAERQSLIYCWHVICCDGQNAILPACRVFGTVSYYVQKLFSEFQGVRYIETSVKTGDSDPHDHGIAASATCQDSDCTQLAFKVMQLLPIYVHYTVQLLKSVTLFMSCLSPNLTSMTAAEHEFRLPFVAMLIDSGISTFHPLQLG